MDIWDTYFLQPIRVESGYNFVNTITYAVLALALLYVLFKIFVYLKIRINYKFFIALLPFILFGSSTRAFVDSGYIVRNFWTISPGIYLMTTAIFLLVMFTSFLISKQFKNIEWTMHTFVIGFIILLFQWYRVSKDIGITNFNVFIYILITFVILSVAFYYLFDKLNWKWITDRFGFTAFSAQLLDAIATALILYLVGGWEKHPLPRFFIEQFGPMSFIPLKILVILPAIYLISIELEDKQLRNFLLMSIAVLGLGESLRNILSLILL
jgi:uncharacterized membrane protein